jgi:ubiquinone/menaquinone biosynthesis C-methylase UbiE
MTVSLRLYKRFYPDTSRSGTLFFYGWMRRSLAPPYRVLNMGAGPGDPPGSEAFAIRDMRRAGGTVDGCDPDPAVLKNAQLDHAVMMESPAVIPFGDGLFDAVYSDYVLEHVQHPEAFLREVFRVLKPGGSFFFRTPNAWHYVSIAARLMPQWVHERVANKARGLGTDAHEPYPTYHRMNTRRVLQRLARRAGFSEVELVMFEGEPSYLMFNSIAFLAGVAYERAVNSTPLLEGLRANIIGKAVK